MGSPLRFWLGGFVLILNLSSHRTLNHSTGYILLVLMESNKLKYGVNVQTCGPVLMICVCGVVLHGGFCSVNFFGRPRAHPSIHPSYPGAQ
ncbi:hypothetical protein B0T22DRAFT_471792 [Podospora appendiculata]|uniref:Uncharacterized protein n=1 Tax=Podospora appendiculata TaxID=314037 RepID=A0AAE1C8E2_9PEZI|nr:hypothetical protein B0T22DRAFT_471792 [Podospora appendiculata]